MSGNKKPNKKLLKYPMTVCTYCGKRRRNASHDREDCITHKAADGDGRHVWVSENNQEAEMIDLCDACGQPPPKDVPKLYECPECGKHCGVCCCGGNNSLCFDCENA